MKTCFLFYSPAKEDLDPCKKFLRESGFEILVSLSPADFVEKVGIRRFDCSIISGIEFPNGKRTIKSTELASISDINQIPCLVIKNGDAPHSIERIDDFLKKLNQH